MRHMKIVTDKLATLYKKLPIVRRLKVLTAPRLPLTSSLGKMCSVATLPISLLRSLTGDVVTTSVMSLTRCEMEWHLVKYRKRS